MAPWRALTSALLVTVLAASLAPPATALPALERDEVSLPALMTEPLDGRDLTIRRELSRNSQYTRYAVSYRGGGQRITGIMNVPRGKGPFPVVVLAHGYIDPATYWSGQGFRREQDALARNGYVALHVDYRNHAGSSDDPDNDLTMRLGYAEDVLNAAVAVRASDLPYLDGERIALLGRSMGGSVAFNALVARPGVFDAAIVYASTSTNAVDNFNRWQREDVRLREAIFRAARFAVGQSRILARHLGRQLRGPDHRARPHVPRHPGRELPHRVGADDAGRPGVGRSRRATRGVPGCAPLHVRRVGGLDAPIAGLPRAAPRLTRGGLRASAWP